MKSLWKDDPDEFKKIEKEGVIMLGVQREYPTLHWCGEWADMLVDEGCPEFEVCICNK